MSGCGNQGLASRGSSCPQSDHCPGGHWPSLAKPWRLGIFQDQNEQKPELPPRHAGWVIHSHGGWACASVSTHPTQEEGGSATEGDSAQPGSRELLGQAVQSWLRTATVPATSTRSPEPASGGASNFPQNQKSRGADRMPRSHLAPGSSLLRRAERSDTPPFIHLRPSSEKRGR